jgi:signal peptidase I
MRKFLASALEVLEIAVIAIGAVFVIRIFLVQPFLVSGTSMSPNLQDGNYLLIDELTYRIRPPERGEIIVFHDPQDYSTYFVKRVIGLPGERVVINNGTVTIYNKANPSGFVLGESYLPAGLPTSGSYDVTVPANEYYVLGDNRPLSYDSRSWGFLPAANIVGLVRLRLWPLNEITIFSAPSYPTSG